MAMDLLLYTEGTTKGHILLIDTINFSMAHLSRVSPMGLKKIFYYMQEALPVRIKGLHFINTSPIMDIILTMFRPILKKEVLDVVYIFYTY